MTISIILADDHRMFRQALRQALTIQDDIELIGEACNGLEAVALARELAPDILVMDIGMPRLNGIEATHRLRAEPTSTQVIILSMFDAQENLIQALQAGAQGYVLKSDAMTELWTAVRTVSEGHLHLSPALLRPVVNGYLAWAKQQGLVLLGKLTDRERQVFLLIAEGKSSRAIAEELEVGLRTVETHRSKAMSKLNLHSAADIVRYAMEHKLIGTTP